MDTKYIWRFSVPTKQQQLDAIGIYYSKPNSQNPDKKKLLVRYKELYPKNNPCTYPLQRALDPSCAGYTHLFEDISSPGPSDWLRDHQETGQSFQQFSQFGSNKVGHEGRTTIYLQPLGEWTEEQSVMLKPLKEYANIFFGNMPIKMLDTLSIQDKKITSRINEYTQNEQLLTKDIMRILRDNLPKNAYCIIGITMKDLYPDEEWNYVFGIASLKMRIGVYSFARYDPLFWGEPRTEEYPKILFSRSAKVMTHEIGHQFGMQHCIYFSCIMNGSNHLAESDQKPFNLCPVCLRKLQFAIGFNVLERELNLLKFFTDQNLENQITWQQERIKSLSIKEVMENELQEEEQEEEKKIEKEEEKKEEKDEDEDDEEDEEKSK